MLPPAQGYGTTVETDFQPGAFFAVPDLDEVGRGRRGEQLEVLPERQILVGRAARERHPLEVDDEPAPGTIGDVSRVAGKTVREVDQRVGLTRQLDPFLDPQRRADVAAVPERRAGRAERPRDDEAVTVRGSGTAGHALGPSD